MKLITELRKNSRQKLKGISAKSNIPISTLFDMMNDLKDEGVIEHKSLVKFEKVGYPFQILLAIKTSKDKRESLKNYFIGHDRVNSIFQINSEYDYFLEAVFRNQKEIQDFVEDMESNNIILKKTIFSIINTTQKENFLTKIDHFML